MKKLIVIFCILVMSSSLIFATESIQAKYSQIQEKFAKLELSAGGRIGVFAIDTANNKIIQYRAMERFPLCSTSKVMAVAAILNRSQNEPNILQKQITYNQKDVTASGYAPITSKHVTTGMNVAELCSTAIEYSDNMAMNLLLKVLGGTDAVTAYARSIDDNTFRLDRSEPSLNSAIPGDLRDTSTPLAMGKSLQRLVLGNALRLQQQKQLQDWLKNNTTGNARIRAGLPKNWITMDKTGTGDYGTTNDVAVIFPLKCSPIVVTIYFTQNKKNAAPRDDVIASATRLLISEFARTDKCIKSTD